MLYWKSQGLLLLVLGLSGCSSAITPRVIEIDKPTLVNRTQTVQNDTVVDERGLMVVRKPATQKALAKDSLSDWVGFTPAGDSPTPGATGVTTKPVTPKPIQTIPTVTPQSQTKPIPATSPAQITPPIIPTPSPATRPAKPQDVNAATKPSATSTTKPAVSSGTSSEAATPTTQAMIAKPVIPPPSHEQPTTAPDTTPRMATTAPARVVPSTMPASTTAGANPQTVRPPTSAAAMGVHLSASTMPAISPATTRSVAVSSTNAPTTAAADPRSKSVAGTYFAIGTPLLLLFLWWVFREKQS